MRFPINCQIKEITDTIAENVGIVQQFNCIVADVGCGRGNASDAVFTIGKPDMEHTRAGRETLPTLAISDSVSDYRQAKMRVP